MARPRRAARNVKRSFACPRCGGAHTRQECDAQVATLEGWQLQSLRTLVLEELGQALLRGAARDDVNAIVAVLAGIESRIARETGQALPTLRRRQQIRAEAETQFGTRLPGVGSRRQRAPSLRA